MMAAMSYRQTQHGPLYLLLLVVAAGVIIFGRVVESAQPALNLFDATGLFIATFAFCFKTLTVEDAGDHLLVHYGPIPLFWHRVPYASITAVRRSRSKWMDGWGIHFILGRGWTYNLWGFDCVDIERGGRRERIGTDDPDGLVRFLESRVGPGAAS